MNIPEFTSIEIIPSSIDEWYGIDVNFTWSVQEFMQMELGKLDFRDINNVQPIIDKVLASEEYKKFWETPHRVECQVSPNEESGYQVVTIRRMRHFDDWEIGRNGGWLGASARD